MESTYGSSKRQVKKTRKFDIEHLRSTIDTTIDRGGSIVMPCFSFSRTQQILSTIYDLYHDDENFKTQVVVDSKLSCDISKLYFELLKDDDLKNGKIFITGRTLSLYQIKINQEKIYHRINRKLSYHHLGSARMVVLLII